jgi:hypothetical protein
MSASSSVTPEQPSNLPRYFSPALAVCSVLIFMVIPMFLVRGYEQQPAETDISGVAATVALGAMLRTSGRNVLRSTFMSAARTMTRALTRRIVRSFLPMMMRLFLPAFRLSALEGDSPQRKKQPLWWSMSLGMLTLSLSFYGVVMVSQDAGLLTDLSMLTVSSIAVLPLLFHFGLFYTIGRLTNVKIELRTDIDGVLLQAYFTGAGSYLPLASDIELDGTKRDRGICAAGVLTGFLALYMIFEVAGVFTGAAILHNCAAQVLLYTFVLSFPLPPLDGSDVWKHSPLAWLLIWVATLLIFLGRMPEAFYGIL